MAMCVIDGMELVDGAYCDGPTVKRHTSERSHIPKRCMDCGDTLLLHRSSDQKNLDLMNGARAPQRGIYQRCTVIGIRLCAHPKQWAITALQARDASSTKRPRHSANQARSSFNVRELISPKRHRRSASGSCTVRGDTLVYHHAVQKPV